MLTTALRPRSLVFLAVSLIISALFVALSMWQLNASGESRTVADPAKDRIQTLDGTLAPGEAMTAEQADHLVSTTGEYAAGSTVVVPGRLQDGVKGFWVVSELVIRDSAGRWDAADGPLSVAVARGWVASAAEAPAAPSGEIRVAGRLLPTEAPREDQGLPRGQLPTLSAAQLTNVWDAPLYSGYVAAFAEVPAARELPVTRQGALDPGAAVLSPGLGELQIEQQPTDTSLNALNLFYAVEWVIFAGFAVFLWWRFVRDEYLRERNPERYFYFEGDYFWDEDARSFYYWDARDQCYYYFDDQPAVRPGKYPAPADRSHPEHGADHE